MTENTTRRSKSSESAPAPVSKSADSPRQMNASEDARALGTNAAGKPVSGKPKKN